MLSLPFVIVALGASLGCERSSGGGVVRTPEVKIRRPASATKMRRFAAPDSLVEKWRFPGNDRDTTLVAPFLLSANDRGVWVWDAKLELDFVLASGAIGSRFGRPGSGPGEFRQVRDIEPDGRGGVALLDRGNLRITIVDSLGRLTRTVPISSVVAFEQFFVDTGGFTILSSGVGDSRAFVRLDHAGTVTDSAPFPLAEYPSLDPLVRQSTTAQSSDGMSQVVAFRLADGFFVSDADRTGRGEFRPGWYLEHIDFPAVIDLVAPDGRQTTRLATMRPSIVSATIDDDVLMFLFVGKTPDYGRIIDIYDAKTQGYRCSVLLPERGVSIALRGTTLYAILGEESFHVAAFEVGALLKRCPLEARQ